MSIERPDVFPLVPSTGSPMTPEAMKAVIWVGFGLCFTGFCARSYIRWLCFRRFLPEDWIMLVVLGMLLGEACVAQFRLHYVFLVEEISRGLMRYPATFQQDIPTGLRGMFVHALLCVTGVHCIKVSFLIFFYRLGRHVNKYLIFWWCVTFLTIASFATCIALVEYKCLLGSNDVLLYECTTNSDLKRQWRYVIAYCTLDAASDVFILCLPIALLWKVRLTLRKKLVLSFVFSLTLFTVAVTILRSTSSAGRVTADGTQLGAITWVWFWLSIQFITAYVIACLVSFRMLFVHNERSSSARYRQHDVPPTRPSGSKPKTTRRRFLDTLLDTFHEWEGTTRHGGGRFLNGTLPSGRMSIDFMHYETGSGEWPLVDREPGIGGGERPESAKMMAAEEVTTQLARPEPVKIMSEGHQAMDLVHRGRGDIRYVHGRGSSPRRHPT